FDVEHLLSVVFEDPEAGRDQDESYRLGRRANSLRGYAHGTTESVFPRVQERAVRMVREHGPEHPSQWAAIQAIAGKLCCTAETLCRWVRQDERDQGQRPGLSTTERQRLKE